MTTLIECIEEAHRRKGQWDEQDVKDLLRVISCAINESQVDWDEGDELWARVLEGDEVVAIVSAVMPLAILKEPYRNHVSCQELAGSPQVYFVDNFEMPAFATSKEALEGLFERSLTDNVTYDSMSINDLWWATVH